MCGIVGLYGSDTFYSTHQKRRYMLDALYIDALRGEESTGIAMLPKSIKEQPQIYKRALNAADFVQLNIVKRMIGSLEKTNGCIGHNRFATKGDIKDQTAHPFQYKHITLVHNGTVNNAEWLVGHDKGEGAYTNVDSDWVAWAFSEEEPDDLLPKMTGAFSLVWWDSRDATLHFARNAERPMYWYTNKDGKMIYFASELEMLWLALQRNDINIKDDKAMSTVPMHHYVFKDPNNTEVFEKRPFVLGSGKKKKHKNPPFMGPVGATNISTKENKSTTSSGTDIIPIQNTTNVSNIKAFLPLMPNGKMHPVELEHISEGIVQTLRGDLQNRIKETKDRADAIGLTAFKTIIATPKRWSAYKGETKRGYMLCVHESSKAIIQIFDITMAEWDACSNFGRVPCAIVNYRISYDSSYPTVFVADFMKEMFNTSYDKWRVKKDEQAQGIYDSEDLIEIGNTKPKFVTPQAWLKLTEDGCCHCGHAIAFSEAEDLLWTGQDEEWPLCKNCAANEYTVSEFASKSKDGAKKH